MVQLRFILLVAGAFLFPKVQSNESFVEYNLGDILLIVRDLVSNSIQFHTKGGFAVDKVVTYHCRTPSRLDLIQVFKNETEISTKLDTSKKLLLVIHGFTDNKNRNWIKRMIRDLPFYTDSNVCIVDWSKLSTIDYFTAANQVNSVGNEIGDFILSLEHEIPPESVSIVGHSLGAHIAGVAGARTGSRIDAIFGLDPAHPLMTIPMRPTSQRLDPSDAKFVQVLHTTSGTVGTLFNIGHQDWYADNGKAPQKGCEPGRILFDPHAFAPISILCSHIRALEIFRFALDPFNRFKPLIGNDVYGYWSRRTPGIFEFATVRDPPYVPK